MLILNWTKNLHQPFPSTVSEATSVFQCSVDREQEQGNLVCALANQSEEREGREARRALV